MASTLTSWFFFPLAAEKLVRKVTVQFNFAYFMQWGCGHASPCGFCYCDFVTLVNISRGLSAMGCVRCNGNSVYYCLFSFCQSFYWIIRFWSSGQISSKDRVSCWYCLLWSNCKVQWGKSGRTGGGNLFLEVADIHDILLVKPHQQLTE